MRIRGWVDALAVFALGLLIGAMLVDVVDKGTAIKDWQGLLAGGLAVIAAYVTVAQMRASDERQEGRHRALTELTLRDERRRLDRANYVAANLLRRWLNKAHELSRNPIERIKNPTTFEGGIEAAVEMDVSVDDLAEAYGLISDSGAVEFFDGRTTAIYLNLGKRLAAAKKLSAAVFDGQNGFRFSKDQIEDHVELFHLLTTITRANVGVFIRELDKLAGRAAHRTTP